MIQTEFRPKVRDILPGYVDDENTGCYAMGGGKEEKFLHIRAFSDKDKRRKYAEQGGICPVCGRHFEYDDSGSRECGTARPYTGESIWKITH